MMGGKTAPAMPAVVGDQRQGVRQAIAHLLALGHRRFAKIAGPTDNEDACTRHAAYLEMLAENGLEAGPTTHSNFMADGGYACAMDLIGESTAADLPPFTALVCDNDDSALGALRALHERGIRIPYDVSVVGYDNVANAPYYEPPLTTVDQNDRVWSHQTVAYLLALIENPHTERTCQRFSPQLIVRHSTQAALR
jgi:LacI family transcriptional regulator